MIMPYAATSHVSVHASSSSSAAPAVGVPMSVRVTVTPVAVPMTSMSVVSVCMPVVRMAMLMTGAGTLGGSMGVGVAESADAQQVHDQAAHRHRLFR